MDLLVTVERPSEADLGGAPMTSSAAAGGLVAQARERQDARLRDTGLRCNAELEPRLLARHARLDVGGEQLLARAYAVGALSARGRHRVVRVARTIADLEDCPEIREEHVLMALGLRQRGASEGVMAA
jgi:magnesium chelatase family protein